MPFGSSGGLGGGGELPGPSADEIAWGYHGYTSPTHPISETGPRRASGTTTKMTVTVLGGVLVTGSNVKDIDTDRLEP